MIKPVGWTSFDVVKKIRNITKSKKVGHGGTLDPFATGVLIIATGKDTKKLTSISSLRKKYVAGLKLGQTTDTLDTDGKITLKKKVNQLTSKKVNKVLHSFQGISKQIPPMFSAKRYKGKRLYSLARNGIKVKREPIKIDIKMVRFW